MISSFLVLSLTFGGGGTPEAGEGAAPGPVPGWEMTSYSAHHTPDDLHKYMNGGAAKYLAYSIQELHVQEYSRQKDGFLAVLELYRMDSPSNAFGVYSSDRGGRHPEGIWQEATYGAGLLQFWMGRYYVRVQAVEPSGKPEEAVLDLGSAVCRALGSWDPGGAPETSPLPALARSMPEAGLVKDSLCFFHNQVSLNSIYYLSDENLLSLDLSTDAVSALYHKDDGAGARVIAVCYPDYTAAKRAYAAFQNAYEEPSGAGTKKKDDSEPSPAEGGGTGGNATARGAGAPGDNTAEGTDARGNRTAGDSGQGGNLFIAMNGNMLVIVIDASFDSYAEKLGARVLAAAECAKEETE